MMQIKHLLRLLPLITLIQLCNVTANFAQSSTWGNTFIYGNAEMVVYDAHNFQIGGTGVLPGIVGTERNSPYGVFSFAIGSSSLNVLNGGFVDGYVRSYHSDFFIFPVGDNNVYMPIGASNASLLNPIDAAFFDTDPSVAITSNLLGGNYGVLPNGGPFARTSLSSGVSGILPSGYWDINGSVSTKITLSWSNSTNLSSLLSNLSSLCIVGWDGSKWVEIPSTTDVISLFNSASSLSSGSITTNAQIIPNTFTVYSLGKKQGCLAGLSAPILSAITLSNNCPNLFVDLASVQSSNLPNGTTLSWHTDLTPSASNKLTSINNVSSGIYYASFFDSNNNCFSPVSSVSVSTTGCNSGCGDASTISNNIAGSTFVPSGGDASLFSGTILTGIGGTERKVPIGVFSFPPGSYWINASSSAYIDGYVAKYGNESFSFPLGNNTIFAPISITAPQNSTDVVTASYFNADPNSGLPVLYTGINSSVPLPQGAPFNTSLRESSINTISTSEYWNITGSSQVKLTLSYSTHSNIITLTSGDITKLTIVGWDGTKWVSIPSKVDVTSLDMSNSCGLPSTTPSDFNRGSITTNLPISLSNYSIYTLGSLFGDQDGDGDPDNTDPQVTNACIWSANQVLANTTTAWRNTDCDGDGVTNYDESVGADGNPAITVDNTNPTDGCSYNASQQVLANTSASWKLLDCDKDGNPNGTDPNPKIATANNDVLTASYGVTSTVNVLSNDDFLVGSNTSITKTGGTAGGTVSFNTSIGVMSYTPTASEPGSSVTVVYQVCNTAVTPNVCASATVTISVPLAGDQDGDGDPDNTDPAPNNPCVWGISQVLANTTTAWRNSDCDGDGVTNYKEATGTDNNSSTTADNTNPLDGCSYNAVDQLLSSTSPAWKLLDCDKDGNPNGTDPNPKTPTAVNDAFTANYGSATGFNILANDDFLSGSTTSLSKTGGTANGTVSFNPLTGVLTYTPFITERGTTVTVTYQVCNTAVTPNVCASATITITIPVDTDADGVPDVDDLDDDNDGILDTVENAQLNADIDGDGIPNRLDLDSDNDGINDVDEANGVDTNGDAMADGLVSPTGIPSTAGLGLTPPDTDNDLKPNPYDLDSNNDGVRDLEQGGLNPNLDANGDGIVDCTMNCDPDGDGILTPVDGLPNVWKDALLPDLTPTTEINSLEFLTAGTSRDFVVNVFEINNVPNVSGSTIGFRVAKISGFTITYSGTSGTSNVFGGTANSNSDWTFTENANFITVTAKPGVVIPQNGQKTIGFTVARKSGVPSNTSQNITVTIIYGSAGEEKVNNNTVETKITAN